MPTPRIFRAGFRELSSGVDSGTAASLIAQNQLAWMVNGTVRGGYPTCRPGYSAIDLGYSDDATLEANFTGALFQVAGGYVADNGAGSIITMIGGRVFRIPLSTFVVQDISIAGDLNPNNRPRAWAAQGQNFFVIQDGQTLPFIYNGAASRRANGIDEIPVANQITYYLGRFWVARGRDYLGGDIVFGPSGSPSLNGRDAILKFTEAKYLNEGGAFGVPVESGDITALKPIASINTALGQGELIVFTRKTAFATQVPQRREDWKNTTELLQRVIKLTSGASSQASVVNHNEDLFFRSPTDIASLVYAVRNAGQWGNTPISNEVSKILKADSRDFLDYASGVSFDNRLLMTASPGYAQGRGVYHRCLAVLDFDLINTMKQKLPPAWEGIWTGVNILQILTVEHFGVDRCFAFTLSAEGRIGLHEISLDNPFDDTDTRIPWSFETRSMDYETPFIMKQLETGDIFVDDVQGTVDFTVKWRPDQYPCWLTWDSWQECAKTTTCAADITSCADLQNLKPQYRPQRQLVTPPDTFDSIIPRKFRTGFEFSKRIEITGHARFTKAMFSASEMQEQPYGRQL